MAFFYRTDLAIEAHNMLDNTVSASIGDGVVSSHRSGRVCSVDKTHIITAEAARALRKSEGMYVTLSFEKSDLGTHSVFVEAAKELAGELSALLALQKGDGVLVACLGNERMTPDAIGPRTAHHIIPTRHLAKEKDFSYLRPVSVIAPGVTGTTGFESGELIAGAAKQCSAKAVIAVDALTSRSLERLCTTVQLSDTGISPGSGLGTRHTAINSRTTGAKVISIGVPTLTSAATVAADALKGAGLDPSAAEGIDQNVFVTVKDIDERIKFFSRLVGTAVNLALQSELTVEDIFDLLSV